MEILGLFKEVSELISSDIRSIFVLILVFYLSANHGMILSQYWPCSGGPLVQIIAKTTSFQYLIKVSSFPVKESYPSHESKFPKYQPGKKCLEKLRVVEEEWFPMVNSFIWSKYSSLVENRANFRYLVFLIHWIPISISLRSRSLQDWYSRLKDLQHISLTNLNK